MPPHVLTSTVNILKSHGFLPVAVYGLAAFCGGAFGAVPVITNIVSPREYNLSVDPKANEAYTAHGVRIADFVISPALDTSIKYTDNVYADDINKEHDVIYTVRPSINIKSDFIRHEVSANFSAERGMYNDISSENYTDYMASVAARLDITGQTSLPFGVSYAKKHYTRESLDDLAGVEPTTFDLFKTSAGLVHLGQSIAIKILTDVERYVFDDTRTAIGVIRRGTQDRNQYSLFSSIGMAEKVVFAPFLYVNVKMVDYDERDVAGIDQDANNYEFGAGTIVNISDVTRAMFRAGHITRKPDDSRRNDFSDYTYAGDFIWSPSTLASFTLSGERSIQETYEAGSSARIDDRLTLAMNYELYANLFLKPYVGLYYSDYKGIDKEIQGYNAGLDATYKMNRNIWLSAAYRYITQDESGVVASNDDYNTNTYNLSLRMQF